MVSRWQLFGLFALLLVGFTACKKENPPTAEKLLAKQWKMPADSSVFFTIKKDNTFETNLSTLPAAHGRWQIDNDSTLVLFFDLQTSIVIDSGRITNDMVVYYRNGSVVGHGQDGKVMGYSQRMDFHIKRLEALDMELVFPAGTVEFKFYPKETQEGFSFESVFRGLLGLIFLVAVGWLFSRDRKSINWALVGKGIAAQVILALLILKVPFVEDVFEQISAFFVQIIRFTDQGVQFLFRSFVTGEVEYPLVTFVITVLPTIIFFSALTSLFYYWGILQRIVYVFAWLMRRTMRLSGAESMAAAGNIFLGQTEAPLLIKPYLLGMTKSEIMTLMTGGMATIAGGVLASYIGFLGGDDPEQQLYFAKHLLAASVMSAPAAIVAAKMLVPEREQFNKELTIPKDKLGSNSLEAIANGTSDGLKLAANVGAMLLVFIALMAMGNYILQDLIGEWTGLNSYIAEHTRYSGLSFQFILGYLVSPIAWVMGVPADDMFLVGQLLGEKTILNEFVAYTSLGEMKMTGQFMHDKSILMATYVLCGFANFASIGIQIGGIGSLVPSRKGMLSELGLIALLGGTMACLFTAVVVGMLY